MEEKWVIVNKENFKKTLLFIAIWVVSYSFIDSGRTLSSNDNSFFVSLALAIVISFVWQKVSSKYLK